MVAQGFIALPKSHGSGADPLNGSSNTGSAMSAPFTLDATQIANHIEQRLAERQGVIEQGAKNAIDSAMNALRSEFKSEVDKINDYVRRMGGELGRVKTMVGDIETRVQNSEGKGGKSGDRENLLGKREFKDLPTFGGKAGLNFVDWRYDITLALDQTCPTARKAVKWIEEQGSYDDISDLALSNWIVDDQLVASEVEWALEQLYFVLARKTEGTAKDLVQSEYDVVKDYIKVRGARAWKRVQTFAWGMTQNRRQEVLNRVANPKRCSTYDELAGALATSEKDVRDLTKFDQSALPDDVKIEYLKQFVPDSCQEYLRRMSSQGPLTFTACLQYVENQIAERRTGSSYGTSGTKTPAKPNRDAMDCNHVGQTPSPVGMFGNPYEEQQHQQWGGDGEHGGGGGQEDAGGLNAFGGKGKGFWGINGNCDNCGQYGHPWRACPKMDEKAKHEFAAKKGQVYKGSGAKGNSYKGQQYSNSGMFGKGGSGFPNQGYGKSGKFGKGGSGGKGWSGGWSNAPYGKGNWGKKGGINELGGAEEDGFSNEPWLDFGIHALMMDPDDHKESRGRSGDHEGAKFLVKTSALVKELSKVPVHNMFQQLLEMDEEDNEVVDDKGFPSLQRNFEVGKSQNEGRNKRLPKMNCSTTS